MIIGFIEGWNFLGRRIITGRIPQWHITIFSRETIMYFITILVNFSKGICTPIFIQLYQSYTAGHKISQWLNYVDRKFQWEIFSEEFLLAIEAMFEQRAFLGWKPLQTYNYGSNFQLFPGCKLRSYFEWKMLLLLVN